MISSIASVQIPDIIYPSKREMDMTQSVQNIVVTEAGRGWSSGTALVDGVSTRWEAYRKDESAVRVMLAQNGRWVSPATMSIARVAIQPTARKAMR